jgi:hypothetical protein
MSKELIRRGRFMRVLIQEISDSNQTFLKGDVWER